MFVVKTTKTSKSGESPNVDIFEITKETGVTDDNISKVKPTDVVPVSTVLVPARPDQNNSGNAAVEERSVVSLLQTLNVPLVKEVTPKVTGVDVSKEKCTSTIQTIQTVTAAVEQDVTTSVQETQQTEIPTYTGHITTVTDSTSASLESIAKSLIKQEDAGDGNVYHIIELSSNEEAHFDPSSFDSVVYVQQVPIESEDPTVTEQAQDDQAKSSQTTTIDLQAVEDLMQFSKPDNEQAKSSQTTDNEQAKSSQTTENEQAKSIQTTNNAEPTENEMKSPKPHRSKYDSSGSKASSIQKFTAEDLALMGKSPLELVYNYPGRKTPYKDKKPEEQEKESEEQVDENDASMEESGKADDEHGECSGCEGDESQDDVNRDEDITGEQFDNNEDATAAALGNEDEDGEGASTPLSSTRKSPRRRKGKAKKVVERDGKLYFEDVKKKSAKDKKAAYEDLDLKYWTDVCKCYHYADKSVIKIAPILKSMIKERVCVIELEVEDSLKVGDIQRMGGKFGKELYYFTIEEAPDEIKEELDTGPTKIKQKEKKTEAKKSSKAANKAKKGKKANKSLKASTTRTRTSNRSNSKKEKSDNYDENNELNEKDSLPLEMELECEDVVEEEDIEEIELGDGESNERQENASNKDLGNEDDTITESDKGEATETVRLILDESDGNFVAKSVEEIMKDEVKPETPEQNKGTKVDGTELTPLRKSKRKIVPKLRNEVSMKRSRVKEVEPYEEMDDDEEYFPEKKKRNRKRRKLDTETPVENESNDQTITDETEAGDGKEIIPKGKGARRKYLMDKYILAKNVEGVRMYECKQCDYKNHKLSNVYIHIMDHTGERPFMCDVCAMTFKKKQNLKNHRLKHFDENIFHCQLCNKGFKDKGHYKQHVRRHLGYKQHVCEHCSRAFITSTELKKHVRSHTGEKPYKCSMCPQSFSSGSSRNRHMLLHTQSYRFRCGFPGCGSSFTRKDLCVIHIKNKHENMGDVTVIKVDEKSGPIKFNFEQK